MCRQIITIVFALVMFLGETPTWASQIILDSASARAVLTALQNPSLGLDEARRIADMPGNQGLVKKAISYHVPASSESFAQALIAAAQGVTAQSQAAQSFRLDKLKPAIQTLTALLDRIDADHGAFNDWVVRRVGQYSPPLVGSDIAGYLVVGGDSGGFSFDGPAFYLNLGYFSEFEAAKVVMAHELYHAVQSSFARPKPTWWNKARVIRGDKALVARQCTDLAQLFTDLYQEGSASYVGDPFLLTGVQEPIAKKTLDDMAGAIKNISRSTTLLELSVLGLSARHPLSYDSVYELGFYGPEILYRVGYVMARAIAQDSGAVEFAKYLTEPGYLFVDGYVSLAKYGKDNEHPALGAHTIEALRRLKSNCH